MIPLAADPQAVEVSDSSVLHISVIEESEVQLISEDTFTVPTVAPPTQEDSSEMSTAEVEDNADQPPQVEESPEPFSESDSQAEEQATPTTSPEDIEAENDSEATIAASETDVQESPSELIFINEDIEASEPLIEDSLLQNDNTQVIILDGSGDGIQQISDTLADYDSLDAIHLLTHGTDGTIKLGNSWLNSDNIDGHADSIASWGESFSENGDILFYGCDLTSDQDGMDLVEEISDLTGADVAASDNTTGHELLGGDWVLEYQTGDIETKTLVSSELQDDWLHVLAEESISDNFNTTLYNNSTGTVGWSTNWVEIGEATDPSQGYVYIDSDRLHIITADDNEVQRGISRTVDLSAAASAYISFDYEVDPNEYSGHVTLQILSEDDPTGEWQDIAHYWTSWAHQETESIDISPYISGSTEIRFESSTGISGLSFGSDDFYVDNLQIDYTTDTWSTPLWLSTSDDVTFGGQQGTDTWKQADLIEVGNPDLTFGTNTSGTFSIAAQMSSFTDNKEINALHYVSTDIQIGSSNFQLLEGDILFASPDAKAEDFGGLAAKKEDIVHFRPASEGNYSAGTFQILFDDLTGGGDEIRGITLIEQDVAVGGKNLNGGDLLFVRAGGAEEHTVWLYETDDVEPGSGTGGTISVLLDGRDTGVDIREKLTGIDLVEETITVGEKTLNSGTILLSVDHADTIGSTNVEKFDIFALEVSSLSDPSGLTDIGIATASMFFDGSDVSFNDNDEKIDGFSLTVEPQQPTNTITGGVFNAQNNTLTLTGTDFTYSGGSGSDVNAYMDWSKFVWDINGDNSITPDITFSSADFSSVIVTDDTTLTLSLTAAKADAIVATAGYGGSGGGDTLDVTTGFSGNHSGEYSITDGLADGPLTTITAPSDLSISSGSIDENIDTTTGTSVGTLSAIDPDFGDSASYTIVGGADGGLFTIGGAGGTELILNDGLLDHERQDSYLVTVRAEDNQGLQVIKTLTITVNDINEPPVIDNNSLTLEEGGTVVLSATDLSASDPEISDNSLSYTISSISGGQFEQVSAPGVEITTFLQSDIVSGNICFVHDGGEAAPTYAVSVTDGSLSTGPATPIINFTPINDVPVFVNNVLSISEGTTVTLNSSNLLASDLDDGETDLNFTASNVVGGQFELVASPGTAIFTFSQFQVTSGLIQFVHDAGEIAPGYDLIINDGSDTIGPDTANVTYTPQNDTPSIQNNGLTILQGETVVLDATNLQTLDPDDLPGVLAYTVSSVTAGQFELVSSPGFEIIGFTQLMVDNGEIQFVHDNSATPPSYLVQVFDDDGLSDGPVSADITFDTVNQAPVLQNNSLTLDEDSTVVLSTADLSATDSDNNDATLIFTVSGVTGGQFELLTNPSVAITSFNQADITNGQIRFIHDGGETQPAYNVAVTDSELSAGPAAATINFTNVNDAPELGNNTITIDEAGTVVLDGSNLSATDIESVDGDLTFSVSNVTGGRFATVAAPAITITSFTQNQVLAAEIQFIHDGDEAAPTYRITVSDSSLSEGPEDANVVFNPQNDAPTLVNNSLTINEGGTVALTSADLSATDIDNIDGSLVFNVSAVTGGQFERVSAAGTAITSFTQSEIAFGEILFIDDGDESIPAYSVTVSDVSLTSPSAPASITFVGTNDAPVLGNNSLTISEGGAVTLTGSDLSASDTDDNDPGLQFIITAITGGQFELLSAPGVAITSFVQADVSGGQVRFIHDGDEAPPSYRVMAYDGSLISNQETVTLTFNSVNDDPTATNLNLVEAYTEDTAKTLAPIVISDVDSGTIYSATFTLSDMAAGNFITDSFGTASSTFGSGILTISGTGLSDVNTLLSSVVFTPSLNYNSNFSIGISVTDGIGAPLTGTRAMTAAPVNDAPTLDNTIIDQTATEDTAFSFSFAADTFSDIDVSDSLTYTATLDDDSVLPTWLSFNDATRTFSGTPANSDVGTINIKVTADDGTTTVSDIFALTVDNTNDAPTAANSTQLDNYLEDTLLNLQDIIITDSDAGELITATLTLGNPAYGSLSTSSGATYDSIAGVWQITNTAANVNAVFADVTYTPAPNIYQDTFIDIVIQDGLENGVSPIIGRINLTGTPMADTPEVENISTIPSMQSGLIYITPNSFDGPEVTHFQLVNINNGSLYQQDGITPINNGDFITLAEGVAGLRFTPGSTTNGSFGVLSSEDGVSPAPQSAIATSIVSITTPSTPPDNSEVSPADEAELLLEGESADSNDSSSDFATTPAVDPPPEQIPPPTQMTSPAITDQVAGQLPKEEAPPVREKGNSDPEPEPEDNNGEETESVLITNAESIAKKLTTTAFGESIPAETMDSFSLNLSFRDVFGSYFTMLADQINQSGISLTDAAESDTSKFKVEDYDLLNLDYRQRTTLEYENLKNSLDSFREETKNEALLGRTVVGSAIAASTGLSAGYVVWMLRSGALLSSILSSLPAWQLADPLAILVGHKNEEDEDEDESIESILTETPDKIKDPEKNEKPKV